MCTLCSATQTFDPGRHPGDGPVFGPSEQLLEVSVRSGSATLSVPEVLILGGGTEPAVQTLEVGETYTLRAEVGEAFARKSLQLIDTSGAVVAATQATGDLIFTTAELGTFRIVSLPAVAEMEATIQDMSDWLTRGYWGREIKFDTSVSKVITVDVSALTVAGQQLARWAMEAWEMVADIDFVEVLTGEFITLDDEASGAWAYAPHSGSSGGVEMNVSTGWIDAYGAEIGGYGLQTYIHELGHALGLGHQGYYNGSADYGIDNRFAEDSWQMSVMSYFSQSENTTITATYAHVVGAMMVDIRAIQDLYGAPDANSSTAGDTVWGYGSTLGTYMDAAFAAMAEGRKMALTIYDRDGTDTLDLSYAGSGTPLRIDLNGGAFSDIGSRIGVIGIAQGTVIETVRGGAGDDVILGNGADNLIEGGAGADHIIAAAGDDTVLAGEGNDTVYGWGGDDTISASGGNNALFGNEGNDTVTGGTGTDIVGGGAGHDLVSGGAGDDSVWGAAGDDTLHGDSGHDLLGGGSGRDSMSGGEGDDTLWGGGGDDILYGGDGGDVIWATDGNDRAEGGADNDVLGGGGGHDILRGGEGDDVLWGSWGRDTLYGDAGDDLLNGGDRDDVLYGGSGNDTLRGGWGADTLFGGDGADLILAGGGRDRVTGGAGADTFEFRDEWGTSTITDFDGVEGDRLRLDHALWQGDLTPDQVVESFGSAVSDGYLIDFGDGVVILMNGVFDSSVLHEVIDIV